MIPRWARSILRRPSSTPDGECNHVGSNGVRCQIKHRHSTTSNNKTKKDTDNHGKIAKHWPDSHAIPELIKIRKKTVEFKTCVILKSAEMVSIANEYCLRCPINGCGCEFADIYSFKMHIQANIGPHGRERSGDEADGVVASVRPRR
ncbi:hypothetical protein K439DRAFT_313136 [Ramaria rubella]|nr:hypothetical protein K439DRAFT_313136 [Ramaria rubella]